MYVAEDVEWVAFGEGFTQSQPDMCLGGLKLWNRVGKAVKKLKDVEVMARRSCLMG